MSEQLDSWISAAISRQQAGQRHALTLDDCGLLARFAQEEAQAIGVPVVFSLADASGHQRYFFSMENALLVSHRLAPEKALTAVVLKMSTHQLATLIQPGAALYGLQHQSGICCIGGGLPCWSQGVLLGGIGISGGTVEQDLTVARNTLRRFSTARFALITEND
ncbi:heme-binding protein [Rahnella perminowiae]|uniref:GlcG/HbpS family heme-binding protein n=1 Tax=Rahnella perminowiae TaxID=2816244 RepID=UPI0036595534